MFQSNIIAGVYNEDGLKSGNIMNFIGNSDAFIDGALYSDVFSMTADEIKYMGLSMRWRGDVGEVADGPASYQVELISVPEPDFIVVKETSEIDTSGYNTNYSNIVDEVLTLPGAQVSAIDNTAPVQAYLNIEKGETFAFDHDTFQLIADESSDYRIKITPDNPSVFQSNIIAGVYNEDGLKSDSIMNFIGNSDVFIDGALYSDVFSMTADEIKYMGLSMRWQGDSGEKADGPAPYQVELEVVGAVESSYDDMLF